jgi:hypothetical protein
VVVAPGDIPITRLDIEGWIKSWKKIKKSKRPPIKDYLASKIEKLNLDNSMVTRANGDALEEQHILDVILDDLESYGVSPSS